MNEHKHDNCRPSFCLAMLNVSLLVSLPTVLRRVLLALSHVLHDEIEDHIRL